MYKAIKSVDDGETWSEPIDITPKVKKPEWSAGSPGPGKGIQMRSGRLIIPRYYADSLTLIDRDIREGKILLTRPPM